MFLLQVIKYFTFHLYYLIILARKNIYKINYMQQRVRAIIQEDEKLLFIHRITDDKEYWIFPGGGVEEKDASLEAALIRECKEELGVQVEVGDFFTKTYFVMDGGEQEQYIFYCRIIDGEIGTGDGPEFQPGSGYHGSYEVEWVNVNELGNKNVLPPEVKDKLFGNKK